MVEQEPRNIDLASRAIEDLFKGRISSVTAATRVKRIFEAEGLEPDESYQRVINKQNILADANMKLPQVQGVRWDNFIICIGHSLKIPEEQRIRERLVPVGTPSVRDDFEDLAF